MKNAKKVLQNFDDTGAVVALKNISKTILRDETYASLKKAILTGKIAQGEKLTIRKLSALSDFSPTPIREALLKLEQDGVVTRASSGQFFVRRFSEKEVGQIFQLRILLETYGATEAIGYVTENDIIYLEENIKESEIALGQGLISAVSLLNTEFHNFLTGIPKNEILQDLLQRISDKIWINRSTALWASGKAKTAIIQHRKIVESIKNRNIEELEQILKEHILTAQQIVMEEAAKNEEP